MDAWLVDGLWSKLQVEATVAQSRDECQSQKSRHYSFFSVGRIEDLRVGYVLTWYLCLGARAAFTFHAMLPVCVLQAPSHRYSG